MSDATMLAARRYNRFRKLQEAEIRVMNNEEMIDALILWTMWETWDSQAGHPSDYEIDKHNQDILRRILLERLQSTSA